MDRAMLAGRETSRLGLGCGRLVGGAGAKASRAVVEQARMLGITHFDVAPSYGLGTAEDVLGEVLAGDTAATIATKCGIGRPSQAGARALARQILRPALSLAPGLKQKLAHRAGGGTPRGQFAPGQIEASFADSLRRLRRHEVNALLLHEPDAASLSAELSATMEGFVQAGRAGAIGAGTGGNEDTLPRFGTIRQYRWDAAAQNVFTPGVTHIIHGALRRYPKPAPDRIQAIAALGFDPADPAGWSGLLLTLALATTPGAILLLSSTSPSRLAGAVRAIDWPAARGERTDFVLRARAMVGG
jgi:hypothetical protein